MITIEGICDQLRRYEESTKSKIWLELHSDTSGVLCNAVTGNKFLDFGNPYQLMEFLTHNTGVRK